MRKMRGDFEPFQPPSDSVGSRDIIERLRDEAWLNIELVGPAPLARRFGGGAVRLADAEAAVRAAADTRTREIVDALTEQARAIPLGDRSEDSYNTAIRMVREVARRFPVSDCDTTRDEGQG